MMTSKNLNNFNLENLPIVIGISGASGTVYGLRTLEFLLQNNYRVDLVISESASKVAINELNLALSTEPVLLKEQVLSYCRISKSENLTVWSYDDIAASISSGSYKTQGMIVVPASMGTIGAIASGTSDNLLTRAADVCLKERRKLILVPREMPFSSIHLENLLKLSREGAIVAPACPGFYHSPKNLSDTVDFVVGKVLDLIGIDHELFKRWEKAKRDTLTLL
jgi:4-hydroxy-3-polyprenylbenzoate decarboxylase